MPPRRPRTWLRVAVGVGPHAPSRCSRPCPPSVVPTRRTRRRARRRSVALVLQVVRRTAARPGLAPRTARTAPTARSAPRARTAGPIAARRIRSGRPARERRCSPRRQRAGCPASTLVRPSTAPGRDGTGLDTSQVPDSRVLPPRSGRHTAACVPGRVPYRIGIGTNGRSIKSKIRLRTDAGKGRPS
jgi:hypothetical protein